MIFNLKMSHQLSFLRQPEWTYVPVMCTHEMDVPGAITMCIRVLMHVNTEKSQRDVHHVYLNEAKKLRPDLITS